MIVNFKVIQEVFKIIRILSFFNKKNLPIWFVSDNPHYKLFYFLSSKRSNHFFFMNGWKNGCLTNSKQDPAMVVFFDANLVGFHECSIKNIPSVSFNSFFSSPVTYQISFNLSNIKKSWVIYQILTH
uniref:Ribosomal protein S2 n=1 Tax=Thraustochytrium aureum TaxID=42467 RepID=Q9G4E1_9STRA|nr:ribosomal protein S2 [Thraustochytrium aureum]